MKRYDIINGLIKKYGFKRYLEIGVFQRENFSKIECELKKCVDPNFPADHHMSSNMFFEFNHDTYDIIFIDGLHTELQTFVDIYQSWQILNKGGFIVVHDCNPETKWHTRPPEQYKRGEEWNGTTYRGFIAFKQAHPEMNCFVVNADYGCGIITEGSGDYFEQFDKHRESILTLIEPSVFSHIYT